HADAEAKLAEVIVASISAQREARDRPSVVLETHSENLFLSLQLAVLQERLSPDDIVVYWMSPADDGSVAPAATRSTPRASSPRRGPPGSSPRTWRSPGASWRRDGARGRGADELRTPREPLPCLLLRAAPRRRGGVRRSAPLRGARGGRGTLAVVARQPGR